MNVALTIIGLMATGAVLPTADLVDPSGRLFEPLPLNMSDQDTWSYWGPMPYNAYDFMACAGGSHQYILGGYGGYPCRELYRNDMVSRTWERLADMPMSICNGGAAVIGDTLYACGGYSYELNRTIDTLLKYCITTDSWTSAPGPYEGTESYNWAPGVVACLGSLYYVGGCHDPGAEYPTAQTWRYTPGQGWMRVADMNRGRVFFGAGVHEGKIYVASGFGPGRQVLTAETEFYDPVADTWVMDSLQFPYVPEPQYGAAAACVGDVFFLCGGASQPPVRNALEFDFSVSAWDSVALPGAAVYRGAGWGNSLGQGLVGVVTPWSIYYKQFHATGVTEQPTPDLAGQVRQTIFVQGMLRWPAGEAMLADLTGRNVAHVRPGLNDLWHLAPGVYFVRHDAQAQAQAQAVTRIVLVR